MSGATVRLEIDPRGIATVWLARPERNNAYNGQMIAELTAGAAALATDTAVRVVVLRGEGRHFQAGADLSWIKEVRAAPEAENIAVSQRTTEAVYGLMNLPKPVMALVHGGCFGGGTGIVAACDVVLADETAIFSISEARWGLIATPIVPQLLSRIGPGRLRRYSLTCERFNARRAFEIGLVDEVCPAGELDAAAAPILDSLLHCPPRALAESKAAALKYARLLYEPDERAAMAHPHAMKRRSEEAEEGLASFLEKRKPAWYPGR